MSLLHCTGTHLLSQLNSYGRFIPTAVKCCVSLVALCAFAFLFRLLLLAIPEALYGRRVLHLQEVMHTNTSSLGDWQCITSITPQIRHNNVSLPSSVDVLKKPVKRRRRKTVTISLHFKGGFQKKGVLLHLPGIMRLLIVSLFRLQHFSHEFYGLTLVPRLSSSLLHCLA